MNHHVPILAPVLLVVGIAALMRCAVITVVPVETKPWGDSAQYINLAASIADGEGYQLSEGNFWPGKPTLVRAPGWPVMLAASFKVVPCEWRWTAARMLAVVIDVVNAVLVMLMALAIGVSARTAALAGILYALNPVCAALAAQIGSEPLGIMFLLLFLLFGVRAGWKEERIAHGVAVDPFPLVQREGARLGQPLLHNVESDAHVVPVSSPAEAGRVWPGCIRYLIPGLMLGLACLVRANWLAIAGCFGLACCWLKRKNWRQTILSMMVFGVAVILPLTPWVVRNYQVYGHFPILGAGGGETFFGGNNELAADRNSPMWGYIVQPGGIPNATPLVTLAATMNEYEVDRYWMKEGWKWLKANPGKIPGLVLGKLRRAFVPIPYNSRSPMVLASSAYRAFLYLATVAALVLIIRHRIVIPGVVWVLTGAVFVANVLTTIIFCGVLRYVIGFEVLLCIPAAWLTVRIGAFYRMRM